MNTIARLRRTHQVLNRATGETSGSHSAVAAHTAVFDERMTPNRIVQEHPQAKEVFERFFINLPFEGSDCVDEVAWRHGMDSRALLNALAESA